MTPPLVVRPSAERDIEEVFHYLDSAREGSGKQFSTMLREVFQRVETNPSAFGIVWRDIRAARVRKFQYVVYYVAFADRVEILAVAETISVKPTLRLRIGFLLTLLVAEIAIVVALNTLGWLGTGSAIRWWSCLLLAALPMRLQSDSLLLSDFALA
jgi:toxin ParE1/3/4